MNFSEEQLQAQLERLKQRRQGIRNEMEAHTATIRRLKDEAREVNAECARLAQMLKYRAKREAKLADHPKLNSLLSDKEATVWYLVEVEKLTLKEAGVRLGVTGSYIRQIRDKARRHLRTIADRYQKTAPQKD